MLVGEIPTEKVGPSDKVRRRRSAGEGRREKKDFAGKVGCQKIGPVGKGVVAGKVALIPCEEKSNSLIFID